MGNRPYTQTAPGEPARQAGGSLPVADPGGTGSDGPTDFSTARNHLEEDAGRRLEYVARNSPASRAETR